MTAVDEGQLRRHPQLIPIPPPAAPRRRVNWYLSSGNVADNAALIAAHSNAITGGYLCCGFGGINASGAWRSQPEAEALAQMAPLTAARLEAWMVSGVNEAAVHSGAWVGGLADAADALRARLTPT
jgi:hypothetical protein